MLKIKGFITRYQFSKKTFFKNKKNDYIQNII